MGRELYFFKFDSEIAREKLLPLIDKEEEFSFKQYFYSKYAGAENDLILENIRKKIIENVELLSEDELWCFYDWFQERDYNNNVHLSYNDNKKCLYEEMSSYGLDFFFKIESKSTTRNFRDLIGDYSYLVLVDKYLEDTCDADELVAFLDYGACFVAEFRFFVKKYYPQYYPQRHGYDDSLEINKMIGEMNLSSNSYCYKLASSEMEKRKPYYIELIESSSDTNSFLKNTENQFYYSIPIEFTSNSSGELSYLQNIQTLEICSELKKKIGNYKGRITRLLSY